MPEGLEPGAELGPVSAAAGLRDIEDSLIYRELLQQDVLGAGSDGRADRTGEMAALTRHLKPKKRHEVAETARLVRATVLTERQHPRQTEQRQLEEKKPLPVTVVDIGCGQGYLARQLAADGLDVIGVEAAAQNTAEAGRKAAQASYEMAKAKTKAAAAGKDAVSGGGGRRRLDAVGDDSSATVGGGSLRFLNCVIPPGADLGVALRAAKFAAEAPAGSGQSTGGEEEPEPEPAAAAAAAIARSRLALVGLHACGDLTPTILRAFAASPDVGSVVAVGCCYHKATAPSDLAGWAPGQQSPSAVYGTAAAAADQPPSFPMSACVSQLLAARPEVRAPEWFGTGHVQELACHALEAYATRPWLHSPLMAAPGPAAGGHPSLSALRESVDDDGETGSLVRQCWRAVLECEIQRLGGPARASVGSVKRMAKLSYGQYTAAALKRLSLPAPPASLPPPPPPSYDVEVGQWKDYVGFFALRLVLAPLLETLIVLDRAAFLCEQVNGRPMTVCHDGRLMLSLPVGVQLRLCICVCGLC